MNAHRDASPSRLSRTSKRLDEGCCQLHDWQDQGQITFVEGIEEALKIVIQKRLSIYFCLAAILFTSTDYKANYKDAISPAKDS